MKPKSSLVVACADVGSVANGNFGWASNIGGQGATLNGLVAHVALVLQEKRRLALGFECPLSIPLRQDENLLTESRPGEGNRPWSAAGGCGSLTTGLVEVTWILRALRERVPSTPPVFFAWPEFHTARQGVLIWEAFVTGVANQNGHVAAAQAAVAAFEMRFPIPEAEIICEPESYCLAGAALLRAGWNVSPTILEHQCEVVRA